jgi:hypothetical protein
MSASNKRKIAVVCSRSGLGRVGSSAMMGVLKLAGLDVGGKATGLWQPNKYNPKGYFEISGNRNCMHRIFIKYNEQFAKPPANDQIQSLMKTANDHIDEFEKFMNDEFDKQSFIAIKGIRFVILPFLRILQDRYLTKCIVLHRNRDDQIKSAFRLDSWKNQSLIKERVAQWYSFGTFVLDYFSEFNYLHVNFEELIHKPILIANKVTDFLDVKRIPHNKIKQWIDPSIVNRGRK